MNRRLNVPAKKLMNQEGLLFKLKNISDVLGVLVGDTFDYKIEMFVVGLHCQVQVGIAYTHLGGELLTIIIVALGGYKDGEDYGDICHYIQQGGNDYKDKKH
jgi:hypothetical protein